jgi:5'-3' exonuclease
MTTELLIIDADSIIYQIAHTQPSVTKGKREFDQYIDKIIFANEPDNTVIFIKGEGNFRIDYEPTYKANRKNNIEPDVKERIIELYEHAKTYCAEADNAEADDYVCFTANNAIRDGTTFVVSHIDKDLNCIPGMHHNFRSGLFTAIPYATAYRFQMEQLLQGDSTDNIKGIKGIGPKTATKLLADIRDECLWDEVCDVWQDKIGREWKEQFVVCANLIYMRESPDDLRPLSFEELKERLEWKTTDTGLLSVQDLKEASASFMPSSDQQADNT